MPIESLKKKQDRADKILKILYESYPDAHCALHHKNPLELLVATILSAQCTDKKVNQVTAVLFEKYKCPDDYATVDLLELEQDIKSIGLFRSKSKSLIKMGQRLADTYDSKVPNKMEDLISLGGVGRKTANVVLGNIFGINEGIVVDTHVGRINSLLKLSNKNDAKKIELDLVKVFKYHQDEWCIISHLFIDHGRAICIARRPKCFDCPISMHCPSKII
ncbi:MAG: endonuclease III [Candidatus Cloacimonadota bacterium]|nr:MAG: endonuclease III [Candidatus Cloacimonadota bacterium]